MRALVLDVDALVHARRPGLVAEIEALIESLPGRAYMERSVYRREAARSGLLPLLEGWQRAHLLDVTVDYRTLPDGDRRFQSLTGLRRVVRGGDCNACRALPGAILCLGAER